jgi:signal transduction histidine kinase
MTLLTAMVVLTVVVLSALTWQGIQLWREYDRTVTHSVQLSALAQQVRRIDQALTLSTHLAIVTRSPVWMQRHRELGRELDGVLAQTAKVSASSETRSATAQLTAANRAIFQLETQAIDLAQTGQTVEAQAILQGETYEHLEKEHAASVALLLADVDYSIRERLDHTRKLAAWLAASLLLAVGGLGGSWIGLRRLFGRYQLEIREAAAALRHAYDRMEAILATMGEGVLLVDSHDEVVVANCSAERMLGEPLTDRVRDVLPALVGPEQDVRVEHPDWQGRTQVLRVNRTPLPPLGWVVTLRDATLEEASLRARSEFISMASHELRTPITIISGYAEILLQAESMGFSHAKQEQILDGILAQVRRLTRIVDDLLKISRLDAGHVAMRPGPVHLETVTDEVLGLLALPAESKGIVLVRDETPAELPAVFADAALVGEILTNLVDNAIKYSPTQTTVQVSFGQGGGYATVRVSDTGLGIAVDEQERIFDRFYRVASPETLRERGTGLGLAISRDLAEMQDGALLVCSEPGLGATFCLTLPLWQEPALAGELAA